VENLTANAARFARSTVAVHVGRIGRWVELTVADDGPGVPDAERARIFERFVRLDTDRSRRGGGAGLGLPIVAELVSRAGGLVSVGDGGPGAVFTVRLPAADPTVTDPTVTDPATTDPDGVAPVSASS
jgi:signal transduction histidine kinase